MFNVCFAVLLRVIINENECQIYGILCATHIDYTVYQGTYRLNIKSLDLSNTGKITCVLLFPNNSYDNILVTYF